MYNIYQNEQQHALNGLLELIVVDQYSDDSKIITEKDDKSTACDTQLESRMTDKIVEAPNGMKVSAVETDWSDC